MKKFPYFASLSVFAIVLVAVVVIAAPVAAAPTVIAGPVTNPTNGHTYYVLSNTNNWFDAETAAVALGGHLATDNDVVEHQWIDDNITPLTGEGTPIWI